MAAAGKRSVICHSHELTERGRGYRFVVLRRGQVTPAFVIRFEGIVHGYLNRCAHRSLELDWNAGDFFDAFGNHLLCATHGARYVPATGTCVGGPCTGAGLMKLAVNEENGDVLLVPKDGIHLISSEGDF
jgi:nitrite reductase/ring-hydroxylating ferredoxin subunit